MAGAKSPALIWHGPSVLRRRVVPLDSLEPWPGNARRHDLPTIQASLKTFGQYRPIVVQASSRRIVAGHGTAEAARLEGWTGIAADLIDVADEAVRILLVDNRANDLAGYDDEALVALLQSLPDLVATGYSESNLADLLAGLAGHGGLADPDAIPEPPAPTTKPGDLWALGEHRLLCGDATEARCYEQLLPGEVADLLWTDPPYGVHYQGGWGNRRRRILNDDLAVEDLVVLLEAAFTAAAARLRPGGAYYVTGPQGGELLLAFLTALKAGGLPVRHMLIWAKQSFVLGRSDYHYQHEPILVGVTSHMSQAADVAESTGAAAQADELEADPVAYGWAAGGTHEFHGGRAQSSVWTIPRPARSPLHPTQKPVELVERAIRNSTRRRAVVLDPFAGSGTTLVAAQRVDRRARLLELDPVNCDVICRRYQDFTGVRPVLVATGEEHDFGPGDAAAS